MSAFGNSKPRDMSSPVLVWNRTKPFTFQHGGLFYEIPRGVSAQHPHLAERLVARFPGDVLYGESDPNYRHAVEPEAEPEQEVKPEILAPAVTSEEPVKEEEPLSE
jgi:hypothetical protein